jgi:hypothetical protein
MGEGLIIADVVELFKDADGILDDLTRYFPQLALLPESLHILSDPAIQGFGSLPCNLTHVKQMGKFLHAISVEPVERSNRLVRSNITLDCCNQLV